MEALCTQVPAAFSPAAHASTSPRYTCIPTERVLHGLMRAGFLPVSARQVRCRVSNESYARHMIRLRRRFETVNVHHTIPEVVLLNSHDGTSAYHLRLGLFRLICTNGLLVSAGAFPTIRVAHRHDVVDGVIEGAITLSERFEQLAVEVQRMEARMLFVDEQQAFAEQALALRYPEAVFSGIQPSQLLQARRQADTRENLWNTFNRVQEHLMKGGVMRHSCRQVDPYAANHLHSGGGAAE